MYVLERATIYNALSGNTRSFPAKKKMEMQMETISVAQQGSPNGWTTAVLSDFVRPIEKEIASCPITFVLISEIVRNIYQTNYCATN